MLVKKYSVPFVVLGIIQLNPIKFSVCLSPVDIPQPLAAVSGAGGPQRSPRAGGGGPAAGQPAAGEEPAAPQASRSS